MQPAVYRMTLHAYEAAALIAAARWAMSEVHEPLPADAVDRLRQVVAYDRALAGIDRAGSGSAINKPTG